MSTCDEDGRGVKKSRNSCDVIYGWPLMRGSLSIRMNLLFYLFFYHRPIQQLCVDSASDYRMAELRNNIFFYHYAPSNLVMSNFLIRSANSQARRYPIVLMKQCSPRSDVAHLKELLRCKKVFVMYINV